MLAYMVRKHWLKTAVFLAALVFCIENAPSSLFWRIFCAALWALNSIYLVECYVMSAVFRRKDMLLHDYLSATSKQERKKILQKMHEDYPALARHFEGLETTDKEN